MAKAAGVVSTVIHCNLQVIVGHINGDYEAKGARMKEYLSIIKSKMSEEFLAKLVQVPREENEQPGYFTRSASIEYTNVTNQVLSFVQYSPTINKVEGQVIPLGID